MIKNKLFLYIGIVLLICTSRIYSDVQVFPYFEFAGKANTNYYHSASPTRNSFSVLEGGFFSSFSVFDNSTCQFNFIHSIETQMEDTSKTQQLSIISAGISSEFSKLLKGSFNVLYQSYFDLDFSQDPITSIGVNPVLKYDVHSNITGKLSGYWNSLKFGDLGTQQNPKLLLGTEIKLSENSNLNLEGGISIYDSSQPSNNHNDLFFTGYYYAPVTEDMNLSFYWSIISADYINISTQKDTTHYLTLKLTKDFSDIFSLFAGVGYTVRNSTDKSRNYDDFSIQIGTTLQPQIDFQNLFGSKDKKELSEEDINELFAKASTFHQNKNYEKAIPLFKKVIKQDPDFIEAYYLLSYGLIKTGDKEEATETLKVLYSLTNDPTVKQVLDL